MAAPTYTPGQVLGAADCNSWFTPLAAYKAADQSVTSSTVLVNDNALSLSLLASATYRFDLFLNYEGGTQGSSDLKFQLTLPTGATCRFWMGRKDTAGTNTSSFLGSQATAYALGTSGAGVLTGMYARGTVSMSTTAGTFQLQWAQNTSNGTATIVHASSELEAVQIG